MKRLSILFSSMILLFCLSACNSGNTAIQDTASIDSLETEAGAGIVRPNRQTEVPETKNTTIPSTAKLENGILTKMNVEVNGQHFTAALADNEATRALVKMMREKPVVIHMSDYAGFEKVGNLGRRLPASNSQTTAHAGDIMLYNADQIVVFYGSNSWSYTKIGRMDDVQGLEAALGSGDTTVTFSIDS